MMNVADIRELFMDAARDPQRRRGDTIELIGESFLADEPYIFMQPNQDYIDRELQWYLSQSRYVDDIPGKTPKIWEQVSSRHGRINSNYGWCVFSEENGRQYDHVLETLEQDRHSRQAVMIYTRPTMHMDARLDGMSDFMCTNTVTYEIRGSQLDTVVQMRSNDAVYGYRNDYAWQEYVRDRLIASWNRRCIYDHRENDCLLKGDIYWQVASLHIYRRHWHYLGIDDEQ